MNNESDEFTWPISVKYPLVDNLGTIATIKVGPGITVLVGPNGSGKTRALRAIKSQLMSENLLNANNRKVHFLSAGRSSPLESYRSSSNSPHGVDTNNAAVGNIGYMDNWWNFESITGDLMVLDRRPDLKLKIEARLQQLFDRSVELKWSQSGMIIRMTSVTSGDGYPANHEASGILQVIALLSAIHNDEIGTLIIDEPEISLHPQHQAFLLEEMELVAGDPSDPTKKLIIIATHSPSMLPLRRIEELSKIIFFNSAQRVPAQIESKSEILKSRKLTALIARLSATHRTAMFAEHVLLVEGPSDEIIVTQLARKFGLRMLARNAQILPVTGKGEFIEAAKLFRLMNKQVSLLADLDALADENDLVNYFSGLPEAMAIADQIGRTNLADFDRDLRGEITSFIADFKAEIDMAADDYPDWSSKESGADTKRRVTLARILTNPRSFGTETSSSAERLLIKYNLLLSSLEKVGCYFLRRGAIENYYRETADIGAGKPDRAALESAGFDVREKHELEASYKDIYAALQYAAPNKIVDEDTLLRMKLGAILLPVMLGMKFNSSDKEIEALASSTIGNDATVFKLSNKSDEQQIKLEVDLRSPLFKRENFPFEISTSENPIAVLQKVLPGINR
ncbi:MULTISPECIES: AAA family ATPase [unclassified Citrobacter]|uniref:ATP-dependent nuclease n=1 Tax=unclassified Citrobacter TaxID=2644389 RepID=UPI002017B310|nr:MULTISPECIES: AAA family ATPase [unclassified Citrobacter]MDM2904942.1 AAA family ATPase [Citrobacter sp. Cpo015]MDM2910453.1 AAA family ATPase [Citrobacter sp. Cpo012]